MVCRDDPRCIGNAYRRVDWDNTGCVGSACSKVNRDDPGCTGNACRKVSRDHPGCTGSSCNKVCRDYPGCTRSACSKVCRDDPECTGSACRKDNDLIGLIRFPGYQPPCSKGSESRRWFIYRDRHDSPLVVWVAVRTKCDGRCHPKGADLSKAGIATGIVMLHQWPALPRRTVVCLSTEGQPRR
ncbi:hypothetical protein CRG98_037630 [Punica granatum]|uniref:Uncharacterized protein n=1 Tax=Punica granatum TaxID=22663 RepID=A0A2I0IDD2_PUNGR|nr:hypothetical protein CRG98_037630 [Punica granatum]